VNTHLHLHSSPCGSGGLVRRCTSGAGVTHRVHAGVHSPRGEDNISLMSTGRGAATNEAQEQTQEQRHRSRGTGAEAQRNLHARHTRHTRQARHTRHTRQAYRPPSPFQLHEERVLGGKCGLQVQQQDKGSVISEQATLGGIAVQQPQPWRAEEGGACVSTVRRFCTHILRPLCARLKRVSLCVPVCPCVSILSKCTT
jgi:hypothetical protein